MPTLRKYKPSSQKSGYYIQANVGGSHPITLQVTGIAQKILRQTGYQPDGSVPTKLVWAMYDLNLVYTKSSINPDKIRDISVGEVFSKLDLGNKLSPSEKAEVVSHIEKYEGPQKAKLTRLKKKLEKDTASSNGTSTPTSDTATDQDLPQEEAEAIAYLYPFCSNVDEFRNAKNRVDHQFLLRSLQTFLPHPYVKRSSPTVTSDGSIRYRLSLPDRNRVIWVRDYRGPCISSFNTEADYVVEIPEGDGKTLAAIVESEVVQFTTAENNTYDIHQMEEDLEHILPSSPVEMDYLTEEDIQSYNLVEGEVVEYNDVKLRPIQPVNGLPEQRLHLVEIDRISHSNNPVIEPNGGVEILDRGNPGERYLALETDQGPWEAISKVIES